MQFTQIPLQHTPLGGQALYTVRSDAETPLDLRFFSGGRLLGAQRRAAADETTVDSAPILRRAVTFTPAEGPTGFYPADGRTVTLVVEASADGDSVAAGRAVSASDRAVSGVDAVSGRSVAETDAGSVVAPARTFLPCRSRTEAPAILTTMPSSRLIGPAESEELSLLTDGPCTVRVVAEAGGRLLREAVFRAAQAGLHLFRLDAGEFPGAESLTVDAGACGVVVYTLVAPPTGACRIAWRSEAGSVEHYTFPVVRTVEVSAAKRRAEGPGGYLGSAARTERRSALCSAYEPQGVIDALAGALASPTVWLAEGSRYTPIDVLTDKAVVRRHGTMGCLEITIRPTCKTRMPWN